MTEQAPTPNVTNVTTDPYLDVEFEVFLKEIGNANLPNWTILAEALGITRQTISRWRQHPMAKQAINAAIEENLREMSIAGKGDWKMHREKLKMLGVKDKTTLEHELGEGVADALDKLERTDYGKLGQQAKGQVVAPNTPLQDKE